MRGLTKPNLEICSSEADCTLIHTYLDLSHTLAGTASVCSYKPYYWADIIEDSQDVPSALVLKHSCMARGVGEQIPDLNSR